MLWTISGVETEVQPQEEMESGSLPHSSLAPPIAKQRKRRDDRRKNQQAKNAHMVEGAISAALRVDRNREGPTENMGTDPGDERKPHRSIERSSRSGEPQVRHQLRAIERKVREDETGVGKLCAAPVGGAAEGSAGVGGAWSIAATNVLSSAWRADSSSRPRRHSRAAKSPPAGLAARPIAAWQRCS